MESMEQATEKFIENAFWLTDSDAPMVASLRIMAVELDQEFRASTMAQYGLSYRYLAKKAPGGEQEEDPLEALLNK